MTEERVQRKLAAIFAVDVVGYLRLTGADETGTLIALRAVTVDLVEPTPKRHCGRGVKLMGLITILVFFATDHGLRL